MADDYDRLYGARPETEPEDELVVGYLHDRLPRGASILDVGCGTGYFLDQMKWPRGLYLGFDYSARMLGRAMEKHPGYEFTEADALNGGWPSWRGYGPKWIVALWSVYYWVTPALFVDLFDRYRAQGALLTVATDQLEGGFSIPQFKFDLIPWTSEEIYAVAGDRVQDITPFAYGGKVVPEEEAHYLCVELRCR